MTDFIMGLVAGIALGGMAGVFLMALILGGRENPLDALAETPLPLPSTGRAVTSAVTFEGSVRTERATVTHHPV